MFFFYLSLFQVPLQTSRCITGVYFHVHVSHYINLLLSIVHSCPADKEMYMVLCIGRCSVTGDCCKEAICVPGRASPVTGPRGGNSATCEKSWKKTPVDHTVLYSIAHNSKGFCISFYWKWFLCSVVIPLYRWLLCSYSIWAWECCNPFSKLANVAYTTMSEPFRYVSPLINPAKPITQNCQLAGLFRDSRQH